MDYKYIEQLLERYWNCETSMEEEGILKAFFCQKDVPMQLRKYKSLFAFQQEAVKENCLGDDFDCKMMALINENNPNEQPKVKAIRVTMRERMMPLFKAAAVVAMTVSLGGAAQFQFGDRHHDDDEINYADYKDTYNDPTMAYDKVENALEMISEGFSQSQQSDSLIGIGEMKNNIKQTE